jgi:hypothetical protein
VSTNRIRDYPDVLRGGLYGQSEAEANPNLASDALVFVWRTPTDGRLLPYVYKTQQRLRASTRFRELRINCLQFQIRDGLMAVEEVGAARQRGKEPVSETRLLSKP